MGLLDYIKDKAGQAYDWYKEQDTPASAYLRGDDVGEAYDRALDRNISLLQTPEGAMDLVNPMAKVGGLLGIVKNPATQKVVKSHFGTTLNPKETGYILDDGTRLDFSGRHYAGGYEKQGDRFIPTKDDYLANQRSVDHREVGEYLGKSLDGYDYGWDGLTKFMDETGAVRYDNSGGVSLIDTNMPSKTQIETIVNDYKSSGNPLYIDIDNKSGANLASQEFNNPTIDEVFDWISKQYK